MYTFFLVLIILVAILLSVVILLQSGKGGGLASTFGGASSSQDSLMGGRQAASLLTKLSWAGGAVFLGLALVLSVLSARSGGPRESILGSDGTGGPPSSPTSVLESEAGGGQDAGTAGGGQQGLPVTTGDTAGR